MAAVTPGPSAPPAAGYRCVLLAPGVARALSGTLLGRLPAAMAPVQVLIVLSRHGLNAGLLSGAQTLAASLGQPLLARTADRRGQRPVLAGCAALSGAAFALLAGTAAQPQAAAAPLIIVSGLAAPPLQSCLRGRWPVLVEPAAQPIAQALDAASTELLYLLAPLLAVALCLLGPAAAFGASAVCGAVGTALIITGRAAPTNRTAPARAGDRLGALREPGLRRLLPVHLALGFTLGAVLVAALHTAIGTRHPALTGLIPAALYAGSTLSGLLYAARRPSGTPRRHLAAALLALTASLALLIPAAQTPTAALAVAAAAGLWLAPALTSGQLLAQETAADHTRAEAAGWLVGALGAGEAVGTAVTSSAALPAPWWPALSAAAAAALLLARKPSPDPATRTKDTMAPLIPAPRAAADRAGARP